MIKSATILFLFLILLFTGCSEAELASLTLFDAADDHSGQVRSITGDKISIQDGSVVVDFAGGIPTATVEFSPKIGLWDASDYRFVRCEVENLGPEPQLVELGFGGYDLTLGATMVPPGTERILKAVIYRTDHPGYIDRIFPVMHGKPDGILRGWMASTYDSISSVKLLFPELKPEAAVRIGRIWLEESYELFPEEILKEKYYPFVDSFGQFIFDEWPDKIRSTEDLAARCAVENEELNKASPPPDWDRYGGWKSGPLMEATGRFRVEKVEGKWWLVDPEGRLFWSHGIDCVEFGTQTRTQINDREHYFQFLPGDYTPEGGLYTHADTSGDPKKYLSFHGLNLFRLYDQDWKEISSERIHTRFKHWGINTIGNWSDRELYLLQKTPYVLTAYTKKTGIIADPYAKEFKEDLISTLNNRPEELNDPWCLGVFVDNELKWGVKWSSSISNQILTAPPNQPAKIECVKFLKNQYQSIDYLNDTWNSSFSEWDELLANSTLIPGAGKDLKEFMKLFTSHYYSSCRDAIKSVDPEMLYLGCRMDFHLYPEDTSLNYIIRIAAEYCDVVSFNRYRYTCSGLVPPDGGDYPIIIGEFHFGSLETGLLQPGLRYAADPDERAVFYDHYVTSALQNPFIVGTHWFQLVDQSVTGRPDGENYQAGFLTVGDVPQKEIIRASRELGHTMYGIRDKTP